MMISYRFDGKEEKKNQGVDLQIADTDLRRWANAVSRFSGQTENPWTRIIDIDFGIARVNSG